MFLHFSVLSRRSESFDKFNFFSFGLADDKNLLMPATIYFCFFEQPLWIASLF